jgi:hypothetical protein
MKNLTAIRIDRIYNEGSFFKENDFLPSFWSWGRGLVFHLLGHSSSKATEIYTQESTQEIGEIKNPLDDFYKTEHSTIHADLGCIVEQNVKYKRNKHT